MDHVQLVYNPKYFKEQSSVYSNTIKIPQKQDIKLH
jgi:hypothetical protein